MIGTTASVTSALNLLCRQGALELDAKRHLLVRSETLLAQAGITAVPSTPPYN